jgi:hypothetical protein
MIENNALQDFWMEQSRLYHRVEDRYGFRLSGAEKMLLKNSIDWSDQRDIIMPSIASTRFLEDFGFDSETFRIYKKERAKHYQEIILEYEFRGKQGRNKK